MFKVYVDKLSYWKAQVKRWVLRWRLKAQIDLISYELTVELRLFHAVGLATENVIEP